MAEGEAAKEGWLAKKSKHLLRGWQRRYFLTNILRHPEPAVEYYERDPRNESNAYPKGVILLKDIIEMKHDTKTEAQFSILTSSPSQSKKGSRKFLLRAESAEEMHEWIKCLEKLQEQQTLRKHQRNSSVPTRGNLPRNKIQNLRGGIFSRGSGGKVLQRPQSSHQKMSGRTPGASESATSMQSDDTWSPIENIDSPSRRLSGRNPEKLAQMQLKTVAQLLTLLGSKEGWLEKRGGTRRNLRRRYFRIHWDRFGIQNDPSVVLAYYKNDKKNLRPKGSTIIYGDRSSVEAVPGSTTGFYLIGPTRKLEMSAPDEKNRNEWIDYLDKLISNLEAIKMRNDGVQANHPRSLWIANPTRKTSAISRPKASSISTSRPRKPSEIPEPIATPPRTTLEEIPDWITMHLEVLKRYLHAALKDDEWLKRLKKNIDTSCTALEFLQSLRDGLVLSRFFQQIFPMTLDERALKTSRNGGLRSARGSLDSKMSSCSGTETSSAMKSPNSRGTAGHGMLLSPRVHVHLERNLTEEDRLGNAVLLCQSCRSEGIQLPLESHELVDVDISLDCALKLVDSLWILTNTHAKSAFTFEKNRWLINLFKPMHGNWDIDHLRVVLNTPLQTIFETAKKRTMGICIRELPKTSVGRFQGKQPFGDFLVAQAGILCMQGAIEETEKILDRFIVQDNFEAVKTSKNSGDDKPSRTQEAEQKDLSQIVTNKIQNLSRLQNLHSKMISTAGLKGAGVLRSRESLDSFGSQELIPDLKKIHINVHDLYRLERWMRANWEFMFSLSYLEIGKTVCSIPDLTGELLQLLDKREAKMRNREETILIHWINGIFNSVWNEKEDRTSKDQVLAAKKSDGVTSLDFIVRDNGIKLLKLLDILAPECVDWGEVVMNPANKFERLVNYKTAISVASKAPFSLFLKSIDEGDLGSGNKKLTMAFLWQLMRHHLFIFLKQVHNANQKSGLAAGPSSPINKFSDENLISWANEIISEALNLRGMPEIDSKVSVEQKCRIKTFRDKHFLNDSIFYILLIWAIKPDAIDWIIVKSGVVPEERIENARYATSVARRLGALTFAHPEDIAQGSARIQKIFLGNLLGLNMYTMS